MYDFNVLDYYVMVNLTHFKVIGRARAAFRSGRTLPVSFRLQQLENFLKMLDECKGDILEAVHLDLRKSKMEGIKTYKSIPFI